MEVLRMSTGAHNSLKQGIALAEVRRQPGWWPAREPGFAERYERFLTAGGSAPPAELLAVVDVDLGDPEIWNDGFSVLEGFVERTG